jgi:hypothetical protein
MPDIFVWTPQEEGLIGYCAFSSRTSLPVDLDLEAEIEDEYASDHDVHAYDGHTQPSEDPSGLPDRTGSALGMNDQEPLSNEEVVTWAREILKTSELQERPTTPSKSSKSFFSKAATILRVFSGGKKSKESSPNKRDSMSTMGTSDGCFPPMSPTEHKRSRASTITRAFTFGRKKGSAAAAEAATAKATSVLQGTDTSGRVKSRPSLFTMLQTNRSTPALSTGSDTEPAASEDADSSRHAAKRWSSYVDATPKELPSKREAPPPLKLEEKKEAPPIASLASFAPVPDFTVGLGSSMQYLLHDSLPSPTSSTTDTSPKTPTDDYHSILPSGAHKLIDVNSGLPSLHFDSLAFDTSRF